MWFCTLILQQKKMLRNFHVNEHLLLQFQMPTNTDTFGDLIYLNGNGNILQGLSNLIYCSSHKKRICTVKRWSLTTKHHTYYNLSLLTETSLCFFFFEVWSFALLIWLLTWSCSSEKKAWEDRRALSFPSSWNRGTPGKLSRVYYGIQVCDVPG